MSDGISESRRRERAWREVDLKHGGKCPHEDIDPMFGACNLCGEIVKRDDTKEAKP